MFRSKTCTGACGKQRALYYTCIKKNALRHMRSEQHACAMTVVNYMHYDP